MSIQLGERAQSDIGVGVAPAAASRSPRVTDAAKEPTRRWRAVPLWTGRALQVVAITMLVIALTDVVLPEGVYWAASYFSVLGLSPEPFLFNAVLLFIVGSAAKRRLRGALLFLVVFEIPTVALPLMNFIADGGDVARFTESGGIVDIIAALLAASVIGMLILMRREFSARSEPASYLGALAVVVTGVVAAVTVGFSVAPSSVTNTEAWWSSLRAATGIYPSAWLVEDATDPLGTAAEFVVSSISAAGLLLALWVLLRSARRRRLLTDDEERHVRRLLLSGRSDDSLAYFATRRDKSVVFSPNREAAVSYRVVNSVALASGDPLGAPAHWDAAIEEWLQVVERYGWRPAVLAPTESGADHYARHGMRGMALGEEALLNLDAAARDTLLAQPRIRNARRRGRQADYAVRIRRQRDIDEVEMGHIADAAARWRGGEDERGFSMALSRMADPSDGDNLVITASDGEGDLRGILVFVPWSHDGCSLDVMRRSPEAINGVTELMVSALIADSATLGIRRVSLNFAVLRDTLVRGGKVGAGPLLRAKRRILLLLSHHWQLDSLRRANEKYQPQWRPRFVMWSRRASFTSVLVAIARAEGFTGSWGRTAVHAEATRDQGFLDAIEVDRQEALRTGVTGLRPALSARAAGVERLRAQGIDPYPARVPRSAPLSALPAEASGPISVAGRVVARRRHGGILFLDIVEDHARLQVVATRSDTEHYASLARVALGDIVSVTGRLGHTRSGQRSVFVAEWTRASSSLRQPPNAWTGLRDPEAQVRLRHIHLATSPDAAELLRSRSRAVQAMRSALLDEGYLEVETPILQRTHGGANARPFRTHINAYDRDLTLRIAPELALKRLVVAGFPQVFEIGRNFRNEGADSTHNPEFTAMEAYRSFADYEDMRVLAERLIRDMAVAVTGAQSFVASDGRRVDVSRPWRVVPVCDALSERMGTTVSPGTDIDTLRDLCAVFDARANPHDGAGALIELLYEELIEQHTWLPTFYTDFPAETSPLARPHRRTAGLAERWDLVAFGMELGTAYSELVDPMEQRRRLVAQSLRAANGDVEAMQVDEDFLAALEYGMPPTGGLGLGVDRIVMAITGATIRQTLAFPFVR